MPYWVVVYVTKHIPLEPFVSCTNTIEWGYVRFSSDICFSLYSLFSFRNFFYHFHCIHKMNICYSIHFYCFAVLFMCALHIVHSNFRPFHSPGAYMMCVCVLCVSCMYIVYLFNIFAHFVSMPMENIWTLFSCCRTQKCAQIIMCVWNILMWVT